MASALLTRDTELLARVVTGLSHSLEPSLSYDKLVPYLVDFGIRDDRIGRLALRTALQQANRFPQVQFIGLAPAQRTVLGLNATRRAAYIIAATKRIAEYVRDREPLNAALTEATRTEQRYFVQHATADAQRSFAANGIDALAAEHGMLLGWYATEDERTSPECHEADGKNFRVDDPPLIGYPGVVHVSCRCQPGPPHADAEVLPSAATPIAAANAQPAVELGRPKRPWKTKQQVRYRMAEAGAPRRCGTCVMFHARTHSCDEVRGIISASGVCNDWEKRPVELVGGIRQVRTPAGVAKFKEPIGTQITAQQYQALLAARRAAKGKYPTGHPTRVAAERAVRQARQGGWIPENKWLEGQQIWEQRGEEAREAKEAAERELDAQQALQRATSDSDTGTEYPNDAAEDAAEAARRAAEGAEQSLRAGTRPRSTAEGVGKGTNANYAVRETDKRLSQGQTPSNFLRADGTPMGKSESGDTYEELLKTHGAAILEKEFGGDFRQISHAEGGSRTTPLDFWLDETYGGELKSVSSRTKASNQKAAIKKEELERKYLELARHNLQPLLVVQVVDQDAGEVKMYAVPTIGTKRVSTMRHIGTYTYTPEDLRAAQERAGYRTNPRASAVETPEVSTEPVANAGPGEIARMTNDPAYQRLLDERTAARKQYPAGHPKRLAAEKAVRQARKSLRSGGGPEPQPRPRTPRERMRNPENVPESPFSEKNIVRFNAGNVGVQLAHTYQWSKDPAVDEQFRKQAEAAIGRQVAHQAAVNPQLFPEGKGDTQLIVQVTKKPSGASKTTLATYIGSRSSGFLSVHPRTFPHWAFTTDEEGSGVPHAADFYQPGHEPQHVLADIKAAQWWVPTDSKWSLADNVMAHEMGHGVHDSAFPAGSDFSERGLPQDKAFWTGLADALGILPPVPTLVNGQYHYTYDILARWLRNNRSKIKSAVSGYAASLDKGVGGKPRELLAELWAEFSLSSNPRGPARYYGNFIRKLLGGSA